MGKYISLLNSQNRGFYLEGNQFFKGHVRKSAPRCSLLTLGHSELTSLLFPFRAHPPVGREKPSTSPKVLRKPQGSAERRAGTRDKTISGLEEEVQLTPRRAGRVGKGRCDARSARSRPLRELGRSPRPAGCSPKEALPPGHRPAH